MRSIWNEFTSCAFCMVLVRMDTTQTMPVDMTPKNVPRGLSWTSVTVAKPMPVRSTSSESMTEGDGSFSPKNTLWITTVHGATRSLHIW